VIGAEQVRLHLKQAAVYHEGHQLEPVALSLGVAAFPNQGRDRASLIEAADAALYAAKDAGRDRVAVAKLSI